jgi:uncharacterized delta-60 repeat protein
MKKLLWITSALFVTACGDNNKGTPDTDAGPDIDAPQADAPIDSPPAWTQPAAHSFMLSATRPDVIMSAAAGPNGSFYAAGYLDTDVDPDPDVTTIERRIIVFKLGANGVPDGTFGTGGKADTGFVFRGGSDDIDIVTLANGEILVSATVNAQVANVADAMDTDIGLIKLSPTDGAVITTWGINGLVRHSFNASLSSSNRDASRGLAIGADGSIYVSGAGRGPGNQQPADITPRTDVDWYVAKFTSAGAIDTTWGIETVVAGVHLGHRNVDLFIPAVGTTTPSIHQPATARSLVVLADGSVISGGYVSGTLTASPQAVVFKFDANGDLATNFATGGIFHETVFGGQTEVYNFALHGDKVVTGGYGREASTGPNDWMSLRFNVSDGARDMTWGGVAQGKNLIDADPTIANEGSNCRNAIALPNGKTLLLGSSGTAASGQPPSATQDAVFVVLDADGKLDTTYGDGRAKYKLSSTDDGADQFWGAAVNGDKVLIVGWRGATIANPQTETNNDNSYGVILDLE